MPLLHSLSFDKNEDQPGFGHFKGKIRVIFTVVQNSIQGASSALDDFVEGEGLATMFLELELTMNGTTLTEGTTTATTTWSSTTVNDDSESTDGSTWHPDISDMTTEQSLNMTDYDDYIDNNGDDYGGDATDYDYDNATTTDRTTTESTSEDTTTLDTTTIGLGLNTTDYIEYGDYSGDDYDYDNATTIADTTTTDTTTSDAATTTDTTTTTDVMSTTITDDGEYDYNNGTDYDYDYDYDYVTV